MRLPGRLNCWIFIVSMVSLVYALIVLCAITGSFVIPWADDRPLGLRRVLLNDHRRMSSNKARVNETDNETQSADAKRTESVDAETTASLLPSTVGADTCSWRCNAHAFYYMWYRSEDHDGAWAHWNHSRIPHWDAATAKKYSQGAHVPENDDIGASYWPQLGPYSSLDKGVIASHMAMMKRAGLGVVANDGFPSRYPPGLHDPAGRNDSFDPVADLLLDAAWAHGMRVAIHLEPYEGRNPMSVRSDFQYIHEHYGGHPALYRIPSTHDGASLPLVYIYDSYHNTAKEWSRLLSPTGDTSIRGQKGLDCTAIFLWVEAHHRVYAYAGFDGFYTYFAATGFVYGSTPSNWPSMNRVAREAGIYFVPSVGPGYIDEEVRPWNYGNTKDRREGDYFDEMFNEAAKMQPKMISITSFNEWHEGTNIEPAIDGKLSRASQDWPSRGYLSYGPDPDFYLKRTREWIERIFKPQGAIIV
ncbi:hypothetical protein FOL47_006808 [Perkinsus chesapeaki]|uniref:Mannosidase, endo-alpha n=1 Tax=Perkinsus chesapeaki TaxID=330153 RepID=A0A7J6MWL1_PERCH|nr:hypothetical protein FOL47_006808 [Perkinsus chesapeaki]